MSHSTQSNAESAKVPPVIRFVGFIFLAMAGVCILYFLLPSSLISERTMLVRILQVLSLFTPTFFLYDFPKFVSDVRMRNQDATKGIFALALGTVLTVIYLTLSVLFYLEIIASTSMPWLYPVLVILITLVTALASSLLVDIDKKKIVRLTRLVTMCGCIFGLMVFFITALNIWISDVFHVSPKPVLIALLSLPGLPVLTVLLVIVLAAVQRIFRMMIGKKYA